MEFRLSPVEVMNNINSYVLENLPNYELLFSVQKSDYKDDYYLHMVVCKNKTDGSYTVWTCFNDKTQSLNHGHYGVKTLEDCYSVMSECYFGR